MKNPGDNLSSGDRDEDVFHYPPSSLITHHLSLTEFLPIPTSFALALAGLGIGVALLLGWRGVLLYDVVLLFACLLDCVAAPGSREISVQRICPVFSSQGQAQEFRIIVRNTGAKPRRIRVRDQTPLEWSAAPALTGLVPAGASLNLQYSLVPPERGVFAFADIRVRAEGPLGLAAREFRSRAAKDVKVFPRLRPMQSPDLAAYRRSSRLLGLMRSMGREQGREFDSLRDYVVGDDPRKIHWKATARLDRPIVQEYQPEKNQIVLIAVDAGRLMCAVTEGRSKLDHVMDSAVQLAHTAMAGGDQPGILVFAEKVLCYVPPRRTPGQLQRILEETLRARPRLTESRYEQAFLWIRSRIHRRSLVVLYTDLLDEVASENLLEAMALLRPLHLPLCVAVRESEWDLELNRSFSGIGSVYERSVLIECLRQRKKALRHLLQRGALTMDVPVSDLSRGVLAKYMEIKRKGLI